MFINKTFDDLKQSTKEPGMPKKTDLKVVQDKIVMHYFKHFLEHEIPNEKFEDNETELYFSMSTDDYNANKLSLTTENTVKWLEYRVISFAYSALGVNRRSLSQRNLFLERAKIIPPIYEIP